jgi:hypothetical protein
MKLNVVKDSSGKVVGAFEKHAPGGAHAAPKLKAGYTVHEVDASDEFKKNIKALYEHHSK